VWTDQADYSPGSVVTISGDNSDGAGYLAGETVVVEVWGPNDYHEFCDPAPVAGEYGAWSCQVTLWASDLAVGEYSYTATGQDSGVSQNGTFTDGSATITGYVKDSSNNAINGATISCTSGCNTPLPSTNTNSSGAYLLGVSFQGGNGTCIDINLNVSATGYTSKTLEMEVCMTAPPTTYTGTNFNLTPACTAPSINDDPEDENITYGSDASFTVVGSYYTSVQWQVDSGSGWTNLSGETGTTLDISMPTVAMSGNQYRAVLTGDCGDPATSAAATLTVSKADATCSVSGYIGTYDGNAHGATGSCTGVKGETLAGLDLGSSFTNVPGGTANWTFTDVTGNYNDKSGSVAIVISKADPSCTITGYTGVYDGDPHGASGSCLGVKGETLAGLDLGSSFTNVPGGTANWTFTDVTGNYNDKSGSVAIVISKADPTCSVTGYDVVYDHVAHTATGSCTGVKGETLSGLDLSGTTHANPGDYLADPWTFTDVTGNYNDDNGTVHDNIHYQTGGMCYGAPGHAILQPIDADGDSVFKQKSTVPAKFRVCDANGVSIGTPGVVSSFKLVKIVSGTIVDEVTETVVSTTPDTAFRWSATDQQWIFNINTKNLYAGKTYFYRITLDDGSVIEFSFGLK
jgi:hypothetical protein